MDNINNSNQINPSNIRLFNGQQWIPLPQKFPTPVLNELTQKIVNKIIADSPTDILDQIQISEIIGPNEDMMELFYLDKLIYRHCIVYIVGQYSFATKKLRFMAYGANIILHSSWGTSLELVDRATLIEHINRAIEEKFQYGQTKISTNLIVMNKIKNKDYIFFI